MWRTIEISCGGMVHYIACVDKRPGWNGMSDVGFGLGAVGSCDRCHLVGHSARPASDIKVASLYFAKLSMSRHRIEQIGLFGGSGSDWKLRWRWNSGFVGRVIWVGLTDERTSWIAFRRTRTMILETVLHWVGARRHSLGRIHFEDDISLSQTQWFGPSVPKLFDEHRRFRAMGYAHPTPLISTFRMHNRAQSTLHCVPMTGIFLTCTSYLTVEPIVYSSAWCKSFYKVWVGGEGEISDDDNRVHFYCDVTCLSV